MNNQVLQLGFKTFITLPSFAVRPRSLRIGPLISLRVNAMSSKRLLSNSAKSASLIADEKKEKKLKGLTGTTHSSENAGSKETYLEVQSVEIQSIKDDPAKIDAMTVQELRTTLRNIGVPAKGRKVELVSALKCFMDKQLDGESFHVAEQHEPANCKEYISPEREAKNIVDKSCNLSITAVSEASRHKQSKRNVKQSSADNKAVGVGTKTGTKKLELTIKTDEVSARGTSRAKRKLSSDVGDEEIGAADIITTSQVEPWTVLVHKKPQKDWIAYNPRIMRPLPLTRDTKFMKLMSWNVNGLRALLKLERFTALELAQREDFDVLCLQETKLQEKDVESIKDCLIDGYGNSFWTCSQSKLGYSGTAIVSRIKPLSVTYGLGIPDHDTEGRVVTAEFDSFYLLSVYVPNSGDGLKRLSYRITQWDPSLSNYMKELEKSKPVILTGDLNCAHQEIDIFNPAGNRRSAGFTDEERESFGTNFLSRGFVDTFRKQHPNVVGYSYWGYRHGGRKKNNGWRLDYFLVSESIADKVHDSYIVPDVGGSDHCPVGLVLKL